jgi:tetratricopeptide (TPR) repeat protein
LHDVEAGKLCGARTPSGPNPRSSEDFGSSPHALASLPTGGSAGSTAADESTAMNRREKLEDLLKSGPDDPFLHYGLAMEDRRAGKLDAALASLATAIACDVNYVAAYFHRGQILSEQGELDAARQALREGIAVAGRTGDAHAAAEMTGLLETLT